MSKTLASHYGENWTDEDKRMFDALVKEEMMKVERGFQSNGSIEEKSTRQVPGLYERNSPQSQETNSNEPSRYGRNSRSNSGVSYNDRESSERVIPGLENQYRSKPAPAVQEKNYLSSLSKADKYYAAMESKENTEQSFTSKLGEYENMSKDQRKLKQREYASQLSQQMSAIQNSTDDRSTVGRGGVTRGRSATLNQYEDNSNTFSIGVDPASQRQAEKLKKQEYARMLNQQVDYQRSQDVDEDNIGRARGYSDSKALSSRRLSRNSSPMTSYGNDDRQEPTNYGRGGYSPSVSNTFQIGSDSYDEKRRKREKQAEYYKQLSADINVAPSAGSGRTLSNSRQGRSDYYPEESIPGGGSLNIGQRQSNTSIRRSSKSVEEQDVADKKKNSQMEYYRMLEQDKMNFNQKTVSQSLGESYQRPRVYETDSYDRSNGTGLSIGRDPAMGGSDRRVKAEEYRLALEQDAANKPYDPTSLEQRKPVRPPSYRNVEDASGYDDYSREAYQSSKQISGSSGRSYGAAASNGSAMSDIMGGGSGSSSKYPSRSNASWENSNSYNSAPRSGSNFRTRGTSTGGGASSFSLG